MRGQPRSADQQYMKRALELAARGQGQVEPNPMVGCVVVRGSQVVGEGWHRQFGGPHAEIEALRTAGDAARGSTLYVSLEPCCHQGKTPPCTEAILQSGVRRVVVAQIDPFPAVSGRGVAELRAAGVEVELGLLRDEAEQLNAPFRTLMLLHRPWIIAKWAMTLDGKLASHTGHSRWISNEASRRRVHRLRGRMDAIMIGRGTAASDDPQLTARPPGPRVATRVVLDRQAALSLDSQLVRTSRQTPVLIAVGNEADPTRCQRLRERGCEVLVCDAGQPAERLQQLLSELASRRMTNLLVEGGGQLLGTLFDAGCVDEVHVFVAPKLVGGRAAPTPIAGTGLPRIPELPSLSNPVMELLDGDVYIGGRIVRPSRA